MKHGVVALGQEGLPEPRRIGPSSSSTRGAPIAARVVDFGDARVEVDPGDWAIVKVKEPIDLPALTLNLGYAFDFADPIFRLGNDYSKGIILSTGYVGQRTPNNLVTCLTDGHPGVSGGGVLNRRGRAGRHSRSAGCRATIASRSSCRCARRCSARFDRSVAFGGVRFSRTYSRFFRNPSSRFLISASSPRSVGS